MATKEKAAAIEELAEGIKRSTGVYLADFTRLTVATVTNLRRDLRGKGIRMKVAKNTFIKRALDECGVKGLEKYLAGPTAVILADGEDPMAPAKMLVDFHKANEGMLPMKVVHIDGAQYPGERLGDLAKMPGKRELQAQVVGLALGPGAQVIGLIKGPGAKIAGQIKALVERLEGQGGQAAAG